jgi:hypothetical protein
MASFLLPSLRCLDRRLVAAQSWRASVIVVTLTTVQLAEAELQTEGIFRVAGVPLTLEGVGLMRAISIEGFDKPKAVAAGVTPILRWLPIADLIVDSAYQRRIAGKRCRNVNRIVHRFCWSCFTPVVVAPMEGGKFVIIDGYQRTTAAAVVGFEKVPCQIVIADREEQAVASKVINGSVAPISRMALQAAAVVADEPLAVQLADICTRAEVELLRYPVPINRQAAGQTMAIGAIAQCFKRYGEDTLITALQCVTQTTNKRPGALSARMIKALCKVLDQDRQRRDGGLALLETFDAIDLIALERASARDAEVKKIGPVQALCERIRSELDRLHVSTQAGVRADLRPERKDAIGSGKTAPAPRRSN